MAFVFVIPAQAGIQVCILDFGLIFWISACAGMTTQNKI